MTDFLIGEIVVMRRLAVREQERIEEFKDSLSDTGTGAIPALSARVDMLQSIIEKIDTILPRERP